MITIVNYNLGNSGSIYNMLKKVGFESVITSDPEQIANAKKLILPGVGSFDHAMNNIKKFQFFDILNKKVLEEKTLILGICLGMQLITNGSEEGQLPGFGWIDAQTIKFNFGDNKKLKIPHMGWNTLSVQKESALFKNFEESSRYYFVHSYYIQCNEKQDILATTTYGNSFVSIFNKDNIFGVQFHPEKSHRYGMNLLKNFASME